MRIKNIKGYDGLYKITDQGDIITYKLNIPRKMKAKKDKYGYLLISLSKNNKRKTYRINRLVAKEFIPNPYNKPQVNHINEIKTDNRVENLNWMTGKENMNHGTLKKRLSKIKLGKSNFKTKGCNHHKTKEKEYYEINPVQRASFKATCVVMDWDFNDFEEKHTDYCLRSNGRKIKKYTYKRREKNADK